MTVDAPLIATAAATVVMVGFQHWLWAIVQPNGKMSGDRWYIRRFAFTDDPVSPPYCWRPLHPLLARRLGFRVVTYSACLATPLVAYGYVGGGWPGLCCALLFLLNQHMLWFSMRSPEYAEGLGHLLMLASLWAMAEGALLIATPLLLLAALCRETLTLALGAIALFVNPWLLIPLAVGQSAAYFLRNESKDNLHPLVEATPYETVKRWARIKETRCLHYAHTVQPLRLLAFAVPFVWASVGAFPRMALVACIPIWLLAVPASGQSRIVCYAYGLFIPFFAELPSPGLWVATLVCIFWPFDFSLYDEGGDVKFSSMG